VVRIGVMVGFNVGEAGGSAYLQTIHTFCSTCDLCRVLEGDAEARGIGDGDGVPQKHIITVEQCQEECIKQAPCGGLEFDSEATDSVAVWIKCYLHLHPVDKATIEDFSSDPRKTVAFHLLELDCPG